MTGAGQSRIFLSDERPLAQTAAVQTRAAFRGIPLIRSFHDHLVAPGGSARFNLSANSSHILLPLSGALHYQDGLHEGHYIAAGQAQVLQTPTCGQCSINNPFRDDYINFLHIETPAASHEVKNAVAIITYEDVNHHLNNWLPVSPNRNGQTTASLRLSIAKFSGRGEAIYSTSSAANQVLIFVIEGAFEAAGCLLHARDGLLLTGQDSFDAEALSNDAIALLLECCCE